MSQIITIFQLLLITLKLSNIIQYSWLVVFIPTIVYAIFFVFCIIIITLGIIVSITNNKEKEFIKKLELYNSPKDLIDGYKELAQKYNEEK